MKVRTRGPGRERPAICEQCGVEHLAKKSGVRFCSKVCSATADRRARGVGPQHRTFHSHTCKHCGKLFLDLQKKRIFCSPECHRDSVRKIPEPVIQTFCERDGCTNVAVDYYRRENVCYEHLCPGPTAILLAEVRERALKGGDSNLARAGE